MGAKCMKELMDFKIDRGSAINKDVPLGEWVGAVCGGVWVQNTGLH